MQTIEDALRDKVRQLQVALDAAREAAEVYKLDAAAWRTKYFDSGLWRKYLPTAGVSVVIGFALGALLV